MKSGALILGIIVSVLLLAAAGILYALAGSGSGQQYRASVDLVRQIEQLSSNWSIELARVKADPLADFDSLIAFIPRVSRLKESLSDAARRVPDLPDRLASDVQVYLNAVSAKEERIERFKTGYAVVRNSTRFLPLAAANVTRQAEESGDTSLTRSISTFMQDVNLFLTTPADDDGRERLGANMKKLRDDSVAYPPPLANALANLLAHAEVLLARRAPTEYLFQEATSNEITDLANQLAGSLDFELARQESVATNYERGVLAVIAVLALFWIALAVQQRTRGDTRAAALEALSETAVEMAREPVVGSYEQLHAMALQDEFDNLPPGAIDRELAAVSASRAGLSAESAMLYKFRSERVGDSVAGAAERLATRMDHLRETHQRIHTALQGTDGMLELPDSIDLDEEIEASLAIANHARREVNGIADLARRLSSHADLPNGDVERDMVDVNACIDEVVEATRADAVATISKRLRDVPEIFASRTEIRLLLAQVLGNSVRAVERLEGRKATIKIDTAQRDEDILITVIDNGGGITPDRRRQIFRPFYTSRDGAMGLGLTLAGHLVKKYEGGIKVNSLPDQGTVTRITLPTGIPGL